MLSKLKHEYSTLNWQTKCKKLTGSIFVKLREIFKSCSKLTINLDWEQEQFISKQLSTALCTVGGLKDCYHHPI